MAKDSRIVRLLPSQLEFIARAEYIPLDLRAAVARDSQLAYDNAMELGENTADRLETALTVRLAQVGFDDHYSPTDEGAELESVIDALRGES